MELGREDGRSSSSWDIGQLSVVACFRRVESIDQLIKEAVV